MNGPRCICAHCGRDVVLLADGTADPVDVEVLAQPVDLDAAQKRIDEAHDWVADLCAGKRRWRMRVPADAGDSDVTISEALNFAESLLAEVRLHRQQRADVLDVLQIRAEEMHEALPTSLAERAIRFGDFNVSARDVRAALGDIP